MTVRLINGDCVEVMRTLPAESVHCIVTSPPYYGLRDYGVAGQIGMENSLSEYVAKMVEVFAEARRVLRDDGTLWLNLGDSYAGSWGAQSREHAGKHRANISAISANQIIAAQRRQSRTGSIPSGSGLKPKDLMGIPWRVAFALQADGWYLRSDIIWAKPNPMPESIRDRPTKAHEYLFLLAKSERYYYDVDAAAEPRSSANGPGVAGWAIGEGPHDAIVHNRDKGDAKTFRGGQYTNGAKFNNSHATERDSIGNKPATIDKRNRRTVWTIPTHSFSEAHFATFPPALVEPCISAGCPVGGTVLDPFGGAGTTGLVADRLQRDAVLIELNLEYVEMARRRLSGDAPLFAEVVTA